MGFHKQPTHRRRGDEPFFYSGFDRSRLGKAQKWSILDKNGQTWQACQRSKVVQKGPKGTKTVNLSAFDHLGPLFGPYGPFWTISDKNDFFARNGQSRVWHRCSGQNINSARMLYLECNCFLNHTSALCFCAHSHEVKVNWWSTTL